MERDCCIPNLLSNLKHQVDAVVDLHALDALQRCLAIGKHSNSYLTAPVVWNTFNCSPYCKQFRVVDVSVFFSSHRFRCFPCWRPDTNACSAIPYRPVGIEVNCRILCGRRLFSLFPVQYVDLGLWGPWFTPNSGDFVCLVGFNVLEQNRSFP